MPVDTQRHLRIAKNITKLLDEEIKIWKWRIGLDPILGLIPGIGDFIPVILSGYMIWIAIQLKLPPIKIIQMVWHIVVDFILGIIPVIGDLSDFIYKANSKNLAILLEYAPPTVIEAELTSGASSVAPTKQPS